MASGFPDPNINLRNGTAKRSFQASPYNVQLSASETQGNTHVEGLKQESADKASELLMLNHAKYHIVFNDVGLHNHIVHHLMSLWPLGATPSEIQAAYDLNKKYQLPQYRHAASVSVKLKDPAFFKESLGKPKFYTDYLKFFQDEIAERGAPDVLNEYVFKGDERADSILGRMYSGFLHPIIHLGFALEFSQPCIAAESLASACIHDDWPLPIIQPVESHLASHPNLPSTSLLSVIHSLHSNPKIRSAVQPTDPPNRVTHGLIPRVGSDLIPHLAKWRVAPTQKDIEFRTAEMAHVCAYLSGAAQKPGKAVGIDFFMMHNTNLSVFYSAFMGLDWLSLENKARLLTWKGWMDAVLYAACGCPTLYIERIHSYSPKLPGDWDGIVKRACAYQDDGHTSKLIRALMHAEKVSRPYLGREEFPLAKEDFLQIAHMTMDSVERMTEPGYRLPENMRKMYVEGLGTGEEVVKTVVRWVRWAGVEGAWDDIPDMDEKERSTARL
ncbi:hypothetical protein K469DRAFT_660000 [Zopfia rhizophila CBS 207.26]|uniref:HypA-like protein n=1 Tax=Zopfia rhizophila CBS 207.26 TaxID=1314779 RepID=A0A6A6EE15_9PEZI|nr:hypothetical protein K469DRAFT_660000 [Zopfia rhizophila CBS 207.26]